MALAEVPTADGGFEKDCSTCEGCFLNVPESPGDTQECSVVEEFRSALPPENFMIAVKILAQNKNFQRGDILPGKVYERMARRYLKVVDFFNTTPLLNGILVSNGEGYTRTYEVQRDRVHDLCNAIKEGDGLPASKQRTDTGGDFDKYSLGALSVVESEASHFTNENESFIRAGGAGSKLGLLIKDLTNDLPVFSYKCPPHLLSDFKRVNSLYGNLGKQDENTGYNPTGREVVTQYIVPFDLGDMLQRHAAEVADGFIEPSSDLTEGGIEVWSDIAGYLSDGKDLPLVARAPLADLYLIREDLLSTGVIPAESPDYIWARVHHVNRVITDILRLWGVYGQTKEHEVKNKKELIVTPWKDFANCLEVDPDLFFPGRGDSTREAKEVCRGCVVREDCLEYALQNGEKFGIWGGLSERERRRLRRRRLQQARKLDESDAAV